MALFTKVDCADCGNPTKPVLRTRLQDGNFVCGKCSLKVPTYIYKSFLQDYTIDMYRSFKEYKKYSDEVLRPEFEETTSYYMIHVDELNELFYIGAGIDKNTVFLEFKNLVAFDLIFKPKELRNGITGQKVEGDVLVQVAMRTPYFIYEDKLVKDVKAKAKKELFGTKVAYENPKGMDDFISAFLLVWELSREDDSDNETAQSSQPTELQQAMALFMLDSLSGVTLSDLKSHRNRLIKVFHPDKGDEADTRYAQKINNAYEVLKSYVGSDY